MNEAPHTSELKSCNDCKFGIFKDHGYSNYTVEGTNFTCALKKHPDVTTPEGFDRFYGEDARLNYANECPEFFVGDSIHIYVEEDNEADLTSEQKEIYGPDYLKLRVFAELG